MQRRSLFLFVATFALAGCSYNKETVPLARSWTPVRAANQQRVVALAVDDAVDQLDFSKLAGKAVVVELSGVFPHSNEDLLEYVRQQVAGRASRAGARVVELSPVPPPPPPMPATPPSGKMAAIDLKPETPEYRVLVGVSWGGLDTRVKAVTDEARLSGQLGLAVGGILAGYAVQNAGNSSLRYVVPGGKATASTLLMVGAPIGAGVWALLKPPVVKTTTLIGRCRVTVNVDPVSNGVAFTAEGSGVSRLVADDASPEGFMLSNDYAVIKDRESHR